MDDLRKFRRDGYQPTRMSDAQLADDWRLLCAKYSVLRGGGKTEFENESDLIGFAENVLREILRRRKITFHPQNMKVASADLLFKTLMRTVKGGLWLAPPHGELFFKGAKTALLKGRRLDGLLDFHILCSDGRAYGFIRFRQPTKKDQNTLDKIESEHRVSREERERWWPGREELYVYVVRDFVRFHQPQNVVPLKSPRIFTPRVYFRKRDDDAPVVIPDFICQVGSSVIDPVGAADIDILFRIDDGRIDKGLRESLCILARDNLAEDLKGKPLHYLFNAAGPHGDYVPLYDLVLRPKRREIVRVGKASLEIGKPFTPLKTAGGYGTLEFSADAVGSLWDTWAKGYAEKGLIVQQKYDGWRVTLHRKPGLVWLFSEDAKRDLIERLPDIKEAAKALPGGDFILDGELLLFAEERISLNFDYEPGDKIERIDMPSFLTAEQAPGQFHATVVAFDCLWRRGRDLHDEPLTERLKELAKIVRGTDALYIQTAQSRLAKTKEELTKAVEWASTLPYSEGAMVKVADSPYPLTGQTRQWAKVKNFKEIRGKVTAVHETKAGTYVYDVELAHGIPIGSTLATKMRADKGDIIEVRVAEVKLKDGKVTWDNPIPVSVKPEGTALTTLEQARALARARRTAERSGPKLEKFLEEQKKASIAKRLTSEEGATRGELAEEFWRDNWHKCFPPSGKGEFVYHHHWRGLKEEETRLSEKELLKTDHSVHGDLRFRYSDEFAWGFTVFTGSTQELRQAGGCRVCNLKPEEKLRGEFKLQIPVAWLDVGKDKPYVAAPGEVGATSRAYAKFFLEDSGTYEIGVWREHSFELFLHGKRLTGRYLITYTPLPGSSKRVWLLSKPADQRPYAETHEREAVLQELRRKNQKYLVWAKPGSQPELINVSRVGKAWTIPIHKANDEKRVVCGVVLEPETVDAQGDIISDEEIEKAAHRFLLVCQKIGEMHRKLNPKLKVVESYVAPQDFRINGATVKKGSWIMAIKIFDDGVWSKIKSGELTGFSIAGYAATGRE